MPGQTVSDAQNLIIFAQPGERFHSVTQFGDNLYKITQHYGFLPGAPSGPKKESVHSDVKLSSSLSRTRRVILELALANEWDYFFTCTLDENKADRFDLDAWHKSFIDWLKYQRKAHGLKLQYLLVPERHADGAWHAHGLLRGLSQADLISFRDMDKSGYRSSEGKRLPLKLRNSDYLNWPAYFRRFGQCSLGPLMSQVAASFYVTKYITKDQSRCVSECGKHMYWASKPLNRPVKFGEFFDRSGYIDSLLVNKYEFCATGFVMPNEGWDSELAAELIESVGGEVFRSCGSGFFLSDPELSPAELEADKFYEVSQTVISGYYS